jgi:hypothetical protein
MTQMLRGPPITIDHQKQACCVDVCLKFHDGLNSQRVELTDAGGLEVSDLLVVVIKEEV